MRTSPSDGPPDSAGPRRERFPGDAAHVAANKRSVVGAVTAVAAAVVVPGIVVRAIVGPVSRVPVVAAVVVPDVVVGPGVGAVPRVPVMTGRVVRAVPGLGDAGTHAQEQD